jgi:hypothetical protein
MDTDKSAKARSTVRAAGDEGLWPDGPAVYVNSAGYAHKQDFRWRAWTGGTIGPPGSARHQLDRLVDLAGSQTISTLCIERGGGLLRMIACNLPGARRDFAGRPIANALALLGDDNDVVQRRMRAAAAAMLADTAAFARALDLAIAADPDASPAGWSVDGPKLDRALGGKSPDGVGAAPAEPNPECLPFTQAAKRSLARELARCALPAREGILVFVAPHHAPSRLEEMGVWRGIGAHPSMAHDEPEPVAADGAEAEAAIDAPAEVAERGPSRLERLRLLGPDAVGDAVVAAGIASAFLLMIAAIVWRSRPK